MQQMMFHCLQTPPRVKQKLHYLILLLSHYNSFSIITLDFYNSMVCLYHILIGQSIKDKIKLLSRVFLPPFVSLQG